MLRLEVHVNACCNARMEIIYIPTSCCVATHVQIILYVLPVTMQRKQKRCELSAPILLLERRFGHREDSIMFPSIHFRRRYLTISEHSFLGDQWIHFALQTHSFTSTQSFRQNCHHMYVYIHVTHHACVLINVITWHKGGAVWLSINFGWTLLYLMSSWYDIVHWCL